MQFTATQIAERHGFTARHWTRLAARGIIPGVRQPSGPGGHWLFDFAAAVRRAGIADLKWHDLRRTAGCRWLQRDGKSMVEVSMLLGHSSVQVTERRYAFLDNEAVAESIGRTKTDTWDSGRKADIA